MLKKLYRGFYRLFIPKKFRLFLLRKMEDNYRNELRKKIISYYKNKPTNVTPEESEVVQYLKNNKLSVFPYPFYNNYLSADIKVHRDANGLPYIYHENKKLYFKRSWTDKYTREYYISLITEQDLNSPHRYLSPDFEVNQGDVIADVGCAEANFSLEAIEKAKEIYLFEADEEWIEALTMTFAPWKEKVHIINKFVSNENSEQFTTLDSAIPNTNINFIKIDAEGAERQILDGSEQIIASSNNLKIAVCTYHKQGDEEEFTKFFKERSFKTTTPHGYMIFMFDKITMSPPYLRRGLIRAVKVEA